MLMVENSVLPLDSTAYKPICLLLVNRPRSSAVDSPLRCNLQLATVPSIMLDYNSFLRFASPNEQRTISREDVGFYHAVIVGAIYDFDNRINFHAPDSFVGPLYRCIAEIPFLSAVVEDAHTDKAFYRRVASIDLKDHIEVLKRFENDDPFPAIQNLLVSRLDKPFPPGIPRWRITVLPLQRGCFIAFSYSHTVGDGPTGSSFHHSFIQACRENSYESLSKAQKIEVPSTLLPPPFDTPERLLISWSFLLRPLIDAILPFFLSKLVGTNASLSSANKGTWTGSTMSFDPSTSHSKIKLRQINASTLKNALRKCRSHDSRITGIFQQMVARALSKAIPNQDITNFVSQTTINMRNAIGLPPNEGGNIFSACYIAHPRQEASQKLSDDDWKAASISTQKLAESASSLQDQATGLLRYAPSIRKWTLGKIGKQRDCSFEISNLGVFDAENEIDNAHVKITQMIFAQPGQVIGPPLEFNLVSVKDGTLVYTVTWQSGALDMPRDKEESFVDGICLSIERDFEGLM